MDTGANIIKEEIIEKVQLFLKELCRTTNDVVHSTDETIKNAFNLLCRTTTSIAEAQYVLFLDKYQKVILPWLRENGVPEASIATLTAAIQAAHHTAYPDATAGSFETFTSLIFKLDYKKNLYPLNTVS